MANRRDKRKLTAILAADVVGYSRLMGADDSGTLAQLKTHRKELFDPMVEEYGGRVDRVSLRARRCSGGGRGSAGHGRAQRAGS